MLNLSLIIHSRQRMLRGEVHRVNTHEQRRVGILAVPGQGAHAVDDHAALFAGGGHHRAPRAHTKGIRPSLVQTVAAKLVIRSPQLRVTGKSAVLGLVNELLGVLNAGAHTKGLLDNLRAVFIKHFHRVPGAVADGQDHRICLHIHRLTQMAVSDPMDKAVG